MNLGEFRKITENYPDECPLEIRLNDGYSERCEILARVVITTAELTENDEPGLRTWIEVRA